MSQTDIHRPGPKETQARLDKVCHRHTGICGLAVTTALTAFLSCADYHAHGSWTVNFYGQTHHSGWRLAVPAAIAIIILAIVIQTHFADTKATIKAKKQDQQDAAQRFAAEQQRIFLAGGI